MGSTNMTSSDCGAPEGTEYARKHNTVMSSIILHIYFVTLTGMFKDCQCIEILEVDLPPIVVDNTQTISTKVTKQTSQNYAASSVCL